MKWVPCGPKMTLSRDIALGFYKHRWEAFPWSCGLAVGWCDGISTGGIREWMCSARPFRSREICFGCLPRGQPAPVELPSASLADAASIVPLFHPSACSEKWYYYRRLADGETGAQSRPGA